MTIPNELMRPSWCPNKKCLCIDSWGNSDEEGKYVGVMCVGRLRHMTVHEPLFNTHNWCMNSDGSEEDFEPYQINYADATYMIKLMQKLIKDVDENKLYKPEEYAKV